MRSFRDSARLRSPPAKPADVRLKMARMPFREDERVGTTSSLETCILRGEANSYTHGFVTEGDNVCGVDTDPRDEVAEIGEEDTLGIMAGR
jgi:hypothetical protein